MISFKSFVEAVHNAIIEASNTLMDKNVGLLDKYFEETTRTVTPDGGTPTTKSTLVPKNVILEYPLLTADGNVETTEIQVPLITMVPLSMSQIEKATLSADFEMEIVDGEVQLSFPARKSDKMFGKKSKSTTGKLEIVISPQESSEGLKLIVEGYEAVLKRQLS
jgi:hypothetical protein